MKILILFFEFKMIKKQEKIKTDDYIRLGAIRNQV